MEFNLSTIAAIFIYVIGLAIFSTASVAFFSWATARPMPDFTSFMITLGVAMALIGMYNMIIRAVASGLGAE